MLDSVLCLHASNISTHKFINQNRLHLFSILIFTYSIHEKIHHWTTEQASSAVIILDNELASLYGLYIVVLIVYRLVFLS